MKVLVYRVGQPPAVEDLPPDHYEAAENIIGGFVEILRLGGGLEIWFDEDATVKGLPVNRVVPAIGVNTQGYDFVMDLTRGRGAINGQPGEHRIAGNFLLLRPGCDITPEDHTRIP